MALVAAQVRVAGSGEISIGEVGTAVAPTDASTPLDTSWKGLGYNTDSGLTISRSMNVQDINAWQSLVPVRRVPTDQTFSIAGEFLQSNADVVSLYLATGAFSTAGTSDHVASADINPAVVEKAVVMEYTDGTVKYRVYVPKAQVAANGDQTLSRSAGVTYPLIFTALAPDAGTTLFQVFTSDANIT